METRLEFIEVASSHPGNSLTEAVRTGLADRPKRLPCCYFYDHTGSDLFEEITRLPEYYLTRCEAEILSRWSDEITASLGPRISIFEFGSGSSLKTRLLIQAALDRQGSLHYVPIDISKSFLRCSSEALLDTFEGLSITALAAEYNAAMGCLPKDENPRLILFLGSNIGNFTSCEATAFLTGVAERMEDRDGLLVGVDLVKDRKVLFDAYNDSADITAQFNKNLLLRINRELDADFDLSAFKHYAPFDESHSRIEMRLVSERDQTVNVRALGASYEFEDGEFILTEWSHKYTVQSFSMLAESAGLRIVGQWTDPRQWFAEFLLEKA